jgi:hypothetical protein
MVESILDCVNVAAKVSNNSINFEGVTKSPTDSQVTVFFDDRDRLVALHGYVAVYAAR